VAVSAALTNDRARHREPDRRRHLAAVGAVLHSLIGFVFVLLGGYTGFESWRAVSSPRGLTILVCAALTFRIPPRRCGAAGADHSGGKRHLCPGSSAASAGRSRCFRITIDARREISDARLGYVRGDIAIAYLFTALFGI
jgi:hypothetical protein